MYADTEVDAPVGRHPRVALGHAVLHFDRASHRVDHAAELGENSVARALHNAPAMDGDRRIEQIAPERPEPSQRTILVRACETAITDHVGGQNRRDFSGVVHAVAHLLE